MKRWIAAAAAACSAAAAVAGPPYVTDDPEPTGRGQYEVYAFTAGSAARDGWDGAAGVDFNYGAAPGLQLTAVLPIAWDAPATGASHAGLGNIELAAKYRFLDQSNAGLDAAFFPRVFLPAGSGRAGERHVSVLLPFWLQHAWGRWALFGGGGCEINRGGDSRDFCLTGIAATVQATPRLQLGAELYHRGADTRGGGAATGLGLGASYDLDPHLHLMASAGPGLQNAARTGRASWYTALLLTY